LAVSHPRKLGDSISKRFMTVDHPEGKAGQRTLGRGGVRYTTQRHVKYKKNCEY
jgi:hypothetical protein